MSGWWMVPVAWVLVIYISWKLGGPSYRLGERIGHWLTRYRPEEPKPNAMQMEMLRDWEQTYREMYLAGDISSDRYQDLILENEDLKRRVVRGESIL